MIIKEDKILLLKIMKGPYKEIEKHTYKKKQSNIATSSIFGGSTVCYVSWKHLINYIL